MKDQRVKDLTLTSMFSAIVLIMSLVPFLGYIPIVPGTVAAVIIHIPVIIAVFILPTRNSLLVGLVFGLGSLAVSFIRPETPLDYVFRNPLVSVLPRVLFTLASAYLARFMLRLNRLKNGTLVIFSMVTVVTVFGISYA